MNYPVIILAGGLGTRLSSVVKDLPKPMAPVAGKPFLHYIFASLQKQGIKNVILSVGYRYEAIQEFFGSSYLDIDIQYSIEQEPLGTGGGIKQAFDYVTDYAYVLNGDTFFDVPLEDLSNTYFIEHADMVLVLKPLTKFDRYGTVEANPNFRVTAFKEKEYKEEGLINGGVYFFGKKLWSEIDTEQKFSFEKEVLEKYVEEKQFYGKINDGYFIDIGIPEDYSKAQIDFA